MNVFSTSHRRAFAVPCIGVQSYRYALDNDLWKPRIGTVQGAADRGGTDAPAAGASNPGA